MLSSISIFDIMVLGIGVYVIVSAIRGKGRLFVAAGVKEEYKEKFPKLLRKLYAVIGAFMLLNGIASIASGMLYEYKEIAPATDAAAAQYELVPRVALGEFSFLTPQFFSIVTFVCLGVSIAMIVLLMVFTRRMTDKTAAAKEQAEKAGAQQSRQPGRSMPDSAFDFSEEQRADAPAKNAAADDVRKYY